tara:strand:- start:13627 stop:15951 length:2325 start_codon:yes stop_codon:yes gene_type:complete
VIVDLTDKEVVYDTEANNLLTKVTKMWCIYFIDVETKVGYLFHDYPEHDKALVVDSQNIQHTIPTRTGSLQEGARSLYKAKLMIAHNAIGYDIFVLNKFFPQFKLEVAFTKSWDTLIQSKVQRYDRRAVKGYKGIHGLDVWGGRLGHRKPPVDDFSTCTAWLLHRCIQDVQINLEAYLFLENERNMTLDKLGIDFTEGLIQDHAYRYEATFQEMNGALLDKPYAEGCVKDLDSMVTALSEKLEPLLPPTMKIKSARCTWNDVAEDLEWTIDDFRKYSKLQESKDSEHFHPRNVKIWKDYKGEPKEYVIKSAAKPTTKLTVATGNYSKGVASYFDVDIKSAKTDRMIDGPFSKVQYTKSKMTQHEVVKNYLLKHCGWIPTEYNFKKEKDGSFARNDDYSLIKTSPKLTEDSYESITGGLGKQIAQYNTYSHRRRFLKNEKDDTKGLLNVIREDGRISCGLNVFGTATGRSSQYTWVNAPGAGSLYGKEIRSCLIAPEGRVLVGADMKSAQLSIAGYYSRNKAYLDAVLEGEEFKLDEQGKEVLHPDTGKPWYIGESGHCVNARAFGIATEKDFKAACEFQDQTLIHKLGLVRKAGKGGSFATIFGATGKKVASTLGIPERQGNAARKKFLSDIGLDEPLEILDKMAEKYKRAGGIYIELPFGYWVWCKSKHKYFNYLDQGTEAACQKVATNYFEAQRRLRGLDAMTILSIHDEFLVDSDKSCADEVGALMCESYKYASDMCFEWHKTKSVWFKHLEFPFNLDGGYKIGGSYWDVH